MTDKVTRVPAVEAKFGVCIDAIYAASEDKRQLSIRCELRPVDSETLKKDIRVCVDIFDLRGRLIKRDGTYFEKNDVFLFKTFDIGVYDVDIEMINSIRIYPGAN